MFRFTLIVAASVIVLGCNSDSPSSGAVTLESFNSVLTSTSVRSASLDCPTGGVTLDAGIDENGNGQLDASEVDLSQDVCNGADGTDGTDGTDGSSVLVSVSPENAGTNCAAGGTRIDSGLDIDSSLTLNTAEITATGYICSGLDGTNGTDGTAGTNGLTMLIAVSNEAAGDMCSVGGKKLVSGPDTNANGSLEPAEVSQTTYVCDGANWWDALGSTGSVTGQVLREEGSPAIGAEVFIEGTEHYTYADGFGRYRFDKVQVGQKRLQINYEGYRSQLLPMLPVTHGNTLAARTVRLSKNRAPLAGTQSLYSFAALASPTSYGASGQSVASAGDVNGDGVADLLIGAHGVDETYLIYGRPGIDLNALASLKPDVTFTSTPAKGNSGQSVASAGDVNGDGFADLLILDPNVGETHLIYGSADLSASFDLGDADVTFTGQPKGKDGLYTSLASAGDVNGDGFADLLIGAPGAASSAGETYLIYGSAGLSGTMALVDADVTFTGKAAIDGSGRSVASAGDVNGDGFADLLIG
ncbi:carboxypeptidase regulatory-like domain-containing protein, partial [Reinekea sp.]|uniref:DUF7151 family protein n=1 Tax=Reinekea sp. TaxID=1970455 RepID=UPI002A82EDAA